MKKVIKFLIILIMSAVIGNMSYGMVKENQIKNEPSMQNLSDNKNELDNTNENMVNINNESTVNANNAINDENIINMQNKIKNSQNNRLLTKEYKGYEVSSKLIIPKINLKTYVFQNYDEQAMWICPTKYFGPNPNEIGNYVIAGHNYNKQNMFNHIIELKNDDKIFLQDNQNGQFEYKVYDIYKVKPEDTRPLLQETNGNIEITLITCSDYSSTRIIVKARAVSSII